MRGSRHALAAPLALCLLLVLALGAAAQASPAAPPVSSADAAFLQSLGAAGLPAPAGFLPARPAATCTCSQELTDCRTLCTGNSCRPDFVCNTSNPCLSSCRCTHCV